MKKNECLHELICLLVLNKRFISKITELVFVTFISKEASPFRAHLVNGSFQVRLSYLAHSYTSYTPRKLCLWVGILFSRCPSVHP